MNTRRADGAYLAYTEGDAHENPKPDKGGENGQGRKNPGEEMKPRGGKNPGEETPSKIMSAPAADTRPAL